MMMNRYTYFPLNQISNREYNRPLNTIRRRPLRILKYFNIITFNARDLQGNRYQYYTNIPKYNMKNIFKHCKRYRKVRHTCRYISPTFLRNNTCYIDYTSIDQTNE